MKLLGSPLFIFLTTFSLATLTLMSAANLDGLKTQQLMRKVFGDVENWKSFRTSSETSMNTTCGTSGPTSSHSTTSSVMLRKVDDAQYEFYASLTSKSESESSDGHQSSASVEVHLAQGLDFWIYYKSAPPTLTTLLRANKMYRKWIKLGSSSGYGVSGRKLFLDGVDVGFSVEGIDLTGTSSEDGEEAAGEPIRFSLVIPCSVVRLEEAQKILANWGMSWELFPFSGASREILNADSCNQVYSFSEDQALGVSESKFVQALPDAKGHKCDLSYYATRRYYDVGENITFPFEPTPYSSKPSSSKKWQVQKPISVLAVILPIIILVCVICFIRRKKRKAKPAEVPLLADAQAAA